MQPNSQDIEELLKKSDIIQKFIGHSHCEIMYRKRENKKTAALKEDFKKKREKEIAEFKEFSATLELPAIRK